MQLSLICSRFNLRKKPELQFWLSFLKVIEVVWFFIRTRIYILYKLLIKKILFAFNSFRDDPIIIAVGDSWFNLTTGKWQSIFTVAILDWLKNHYKYNIFNMAIPGYTFTDEIKYELYKYPMQKIAKKQKQVIILLSMGGNDVMFADVKNMITRKGAQYEIHKKRIRKFIRVFIKSFNTYIKGIEKRFKILGGQKLKILIHGYGYVRLKENEENKNLSSIFDRYNIPIDIANKSLRVFIDIFNDELKELAKKDNRLEYVDLRKIVEEDEFMDDIHPTRDAYRKIASKYDKILSKYIKK